MKALRLLAVLTSAALLAIGPRYVAHASSRVVWRPDLSRAEDSCPPSRPSVELVAIHRAKGHRKFYGKVPRSGMSDTLIMLDEISSFDADGLLELRVCAHDDRASMERLGWRARVVAGELPGLVGGTVPSSDYLRRDPSHASSDSSGQILYLTWKDWSPPMGARRDSLRAGIVLSCVDRAANESSYSDTLWVSAPAR